jgi:hypothetical protein
MRTTFTFLLLLFILGKCFSQQNFLVNEGSLNSNEEFLSATQTTDKNYVAVGYTTVNSVDSNIHMVKVDRNGILLWTKTITGGGHDVAIGVISTTDGGFAISGTLHDKMALLKFDSLGNLLWNKQYDELKGSIGRSMVQTSDGYLMAGGITADGNFDSSIAYLIKTDASGNVLWSKKYFTASAYSIINDLKPTKDGNYVFLSENKKSNDSAWVVKIDPSGNVLWAKYFFDAVSKTSGYSILPTIDAGYLVSGTRTNLSNNGFLLKLTPAGAKIWSKTTNTDGSADIVFHSSVSGVEGGYATMGSATTPDSNFYYLLKADESGALQFTKTLKKASNDNKGTFFSAITSVSDGYLVAGSVRDASGFLDGNLLRLDLNYSSCKPSTGTYGTIIDYGTLNTGQTTPVSGSTVVTIDNVTISVTGVQTLVCTALPLNLISFNATLQKKSVLLQWTTAQEVNTAYFNVEKSQDGKMFTAFKQAAAAGNASGVSSYSITDAQPFAGESWYRLKMVDKDGQYVYSNAIAINNLLQKTITINPNPVANVLNLNVQSLTAGKATIVISDVNGKLLLQKAITVSSGSNIIPLAVDQLTKGMYILKFVQDNYTENLKWIKQ